MAFIFHNNDDHFFFSLKRSLPVNIPVFYCIRFKVKDTVRDYIPPDEPGTRKNPLYRKLFDGFDKIDGKPTEAERRVSVPYTA